MRSCCRLHSFFEGKYLMQVNRRGVPNVLPLWQRCWHSIRGMGLSSCCEGRVIEGVVVHRSLASVHAQRGMPTRFMTLGH